MKKILYPVFALLAICCNFAACSDDDNDGPAVSQTPATDCAGTYSGTWTVDSTHASQTSTRRSGKVVITGDTVSGSTTIPGTAIVAASDSSNFIASLTLNCGRFINCTSPVNISARSAGYFFENTNPAGNGLRDFLGKKNTPIAFMGTVSNNNELTTSFTIVSNDTVGSRRSSTINAWTYKYTFNGVKQ